MTQIAGVDSFGGAVVALFTLPEAQRMAGKVGSFDEIDASRGSAASHPRSCEARLRAALPASVDVRTGQRAGRRAVQATSATNLGFLRTALLAFAGISLFVGAFIIFNTFSITVAQRTREFALLRTLGATRRQVLRSVLAEGLVLGVARGARSGSALGIAARAAGCARCSRSSGFDAAVDGDGDRDADDRRLAARRHVVTLLSSLHARRSAPRACRRSPRCARARCCRPGAAPGCVDPDRGRSLTVARPSRCCASACSAACDVRRRAELRRAAARPRCSSASRC